MIIKEISTQSTNPDGSRPFIVRDSKNYSPEEWKKILEYLKRNHAAGLLKMEVI